MLTGPISRNSEKLLDLDVSSSLTTKQPGAAAGCSRIRVSFHGRSEVNPSLCCPKTMQAMSAAEHCVLNVHTCAPKSLTCFRGAKSDLAPFVLAWAETCLPCSAFRQQVQNHREGTCKCRAHKCTCMPSREVDIWSMGCIFTEINGGPLPCAGTCLSNEDVALVQSRCDRFHAQGVFVVPC